MNRCYYAAFYAASAVLLRGGHHFVKHAGVRDALNMHLVKTGKLSTEWGRHYNRLFEQRLAADYTAFAAFEPATVQQWLEQSRQFVAALRALSS